MAKLLSSLPVGTVIKDTSTTYNGKPILWKVMEHGHSGDPSGSTALVTKNIISLKCFDALESGNSDNDRKQYGNNRYSLSNLLQFLNSDAAAGKWYSAKHSADAAPTNANVGSNYNEYDQEAGFLTNFSAQMKNALIEVTKKTVKNTVTDGGDYENVVSKIFLLSTTEVGLADENSIAEGSIYALFNTASERIAYPTAEAVSKSEYTNTNLTASKAWRYYLRTPNASISYNVRRVNTDGSLGYGNAYSGNYGVRPACAISSSTLVSDTADSDGAYTIQWNAAPTILPASCDYGSVNSAPAITLTVADEDSASFTGSVKVDGTEKQTFTGSESKSVTLDTASWWSSLSLASHTITVTVTDSDGAATTNTYTFIKTNSTAQAPTITNTVTGNRKGTEFYVEFTTGADEEGDKQTVKVQVADDEAFSTNLQEFTTVEKYVDGVWTEITEITNADAGIPLRIKVTGQTLGTEKYIRAVTTDAGSHTAVSSPNAKVSIGDVLEIITIPAEKASQPKTISVRLDGNIDAGAVVEILVTNNAFDETPVWENYVQKTVHTFENETKSADKWGVAVKAKISAGSATGAIELSTVAISVG